MKVFITGHKGFLGTEFIKAYNDIYDFIGYDIVDGEDLNDYKKLKEKMQRCDIVVHLAAIPKPIPEKKFSDYMEINVRGTECVLQAAYENNIKKLIYASSTTIYGIEKGIPFQNPITEDQAFLSQYIKADQLDTRSCDLSYHISKVMAEQVCAWYGLNKKIQVISLRFGPIGKVFLGTSVSIPNATQILHKSIEIKKELWYETFSAVDDEISHISIDKAKKILGYLPQRPSYSKDQIHSLLQ